jgi:integrase
VEALDLAGVRRQRHLVDPDVRRKPGRRGPNRDFAESVDVALGTGCRAGEVLALQWKHLDLTGPTPIVTISGTLVEPRSHFVDRLDRQETLTSGRTRRLILPDHVVLLLRARRETPSATLQTTRSSHRGTVRDCGPTTSARACVRPSSERRWPAPLLTRCAARSARWSLMRRPSMLRVGSWAISDPSVTWQEYVAARPVAPDLRHLLDQFFTNQEEK